jgi:putative oxygen-independent coproporphyrinogen III oxidase
LNTLLNEDWELGGFGIYIHWPFCTAKCPYCDFNSHVSSHIDEKLWLEAYLKEISRIHQLTKGRIVKSIFFGGGTPSLMSPDLVYDILSHTRSLWLINNDCEITLEANPTSVEAQKFIEFKDAGISRISMGIQSLNDRDLKRLGRQHSAREALGAFTIARNIFNRVSFDLIYARQDQSISEWRSELQQALSGDLDHLSLYQLTIEEGTAFGDRYAIGKLKGLPDEDRASDLFEVTQELCELNGMPAYEVSNHARPGLECQHNIVYWKYGDYAGIGPGAHGRLTLKNDRYSTEGYLQPDRWLLEVSGGCGDKLVQKLPLKDQGQEFVLMGMRLTEGICKDRYQNFFGHPPKPTVVQNLERDGLIKATADRIYATPRGRMLLNYVIGNLLVN